MLTGFILIGGVGVGTLGAFATEGTVVAGEVVARGIWAAGSTLTGLVTRKHFSLCAFSMLEKRNRWPHTSHGYGFSPVCVRRCLFMFGRLVKLLPQISQIKGFSPVKNRNMALV